MPITQAYSFDNASNFNLTNTVIAAGKAKLALIPNPDQVFAQDFASSTGFTFDSSKVEFVAGVMRQKDQTATDMRLGAQFSSVIAANWNKDGSNTATLTGSPTITSNKLACQGAQGVYFVSPITTAGAVKLKYTPNYNGSPSQNANIISLQIDASNVNNRLTLTHSPSGGTFRIFLNNITGATLYNAQAIGAQWVAVLGTEYELELDYSATTGTIRLFINGVLHGTLNFGAFDRANNIAGRVYIGAAPSTYNWAEASFRDVVVFNAVQHTAGYTPGYSIVPYLYAGSLVNGPNFTYTGVGTVLSIDSGDVSEVGFPRFIVGTKYWNGTAWVASNNTYAQANDFATALAHFDEFVASGGVLPWSVVFTDSNSISSIDEFEVVVTGQKYSPTGYLEPVQALQVMNLLSYTHTISETLNAFVKVILKIDGVLKWWNGTAWVTSNGTPAQSNTAQEVNDNVADLDLGVNSSVYVRWVLYTSSNIETSEIDEASVGFNFGAVETPLSTCIVFGYLKDISDTPVVGATIKFDLNQKTKFFNEANKNVIGTGSVTVTTDENGYFSTPLVRSSEYEGEAAYKLTITIGQIVITKNSEGYITFSVPDSETKDITDLVAP